MLVPGVTHRRTVRGTSLLGRRCHAVGMLRSPGMGVLSHCPTGRADVFEEHHNGVSRRRDKDLRNANGFAKQAPRFCPLKSPRYRVFGRQPDKVYVRMVLGNRRTRNSIHT